MIAGTILREMLGRRASLLDFHGDKKGYVLIHAKVDSHGVLHHIMDQPGALEPLLPELDTIKIRDKNDKSYYLRLKESYECKAVPLLSQG